MVGRSREALFALPDVGRLFATEDQYTDLLRRLDADGRVQGHDCRVSAADDSEERFRTMVQLVPDVISRVDEHGRLELVNRAVRQFGYQPAEQIGQPISRLLCPGESGRMAQAVAAAKGDDAPHPEPGEGAIGQALEMRVTANPAAPRGRATADCTAEDDAVVCEVNLSVCCTRPRAGCARSPSWPWTSPP